MSHLWRMKRAWRAQSATWGLWWCGMVLDLSAFVECEARCDTGWDCGAKWTRALALAPNWSDHLI